MRNSTSPAPKSDREFDVVLYGATSYGGVLTPATGLGNVLVERLRAAGVTLAVD